MQGVARRRDKRGYGGVWIAVPNGGGHADVGDVARMGAVVADQIATLRHNAASSCASQRQMGHLGIRTCRSCTGLREASQIPSRPNHGSCCVGATAASQRIILKGDVPSPIGRGAGAGQESTLIGELDGFASQAEAKMACFSYIEGWYNPVRLHSGLGYRSPITYEADMQAAMTKT
jgi:hypothetical protein